MTIKKQNRHIGTSFDDFLLEHGIWAEVTTRACKKAIAQFVTAFMEREDVSKAEMARRMKTSRTALDRLLDANVSGVTLDTLERAASAMGKRVKIEFEDVASPDAVEFERRIAG